FFDADAVGAYSECGRERLEERYRDTGAANEIRAKMYPVGMSELDAMRRIDPEEVRHRLGLARDRPIVLYLSFPLASNPPTFWLRGVFTPRTRLGMAARVLLGGRPEYWPEEGHSPNDRPPVGGGAGSCARAGWARGITRS